MINRDRFEQLAALALTGEATATDCAELEAALADEPSLVDELIELGATDQMLRRAAGRPASELESMPSRVLETLEGVRRDALSARAVTTARAAGAETVVPFRQPDAKKRHILTRLALAASVVILAGLAFFLIPSRNSSKDIAVLAPRGSTGFTQPTLAWDARPGQLYDVWILPAEGSHMDAPALYIAKGVRPPVAFAELKPGPALKAQDGDAHALAAGQDYRLLVCLAGAGRIAGTAYPFRTDPGATAHPPPATLAGARTLVTQGRTSDALAILAALPETERSQPEVRALETELRAELLPPTKP